MSQQPHDPQQEQQLLQHFRQHSQGEPSAALDALILDAARQAVAPATPSAAQRLHAWLFGSGSRTRWSVAFAGLATLGIGLSLTWRTQEQAPSTYDVPAPVTAQAPAAPVLREMASGVASEARKQVAAPEQKKAEMAESMAGAIDPNASYGASAPADDLQRQMAPGKPQSAPAVESLADSAVAPVESDATQDEAKAKAYAAARTKALAVDRAKAQAEEQARASQQSRAAGQSLAEEAPPLELRLRNVLRLREEGRQAEADRQLQALRPEYPQLDLDAELKRLQVEVEKPGSSR